MLIIKALEYTYENTNLEDFIDLRNSLIKELCFLTNTDEQVFVDYLESDD